VQRDVPRRLMLLGLWVAFLADLVVGAGFLLSRARVLFVTGLAMVLAACLVMAGFTLYHYVQQRRAAPPPKQE